MNRRRIAGVAHIQTQQKADDEGEEPGAPSEKRRGSARMMIHE